MKCRQGVGRVSAGCRQGVDRVSQIDQIDQDSRFRVNVDTSSTPCRHPADTLPTPPCIDYSSTLTTIIGEFNKMSTL